MLPAQAQKLVRSWVGCVLSTPGSGTLNKNARCSPPSADVSGRWSSWRGSRRRTREEGWLEGGLEMRVASVPCMACLNLLSLPVEQCAEPDDPRAFQLWGLLAPFSYTVPGVYLQDPEVIFRWRTLCALPC